MWVHALFILPITDKGLQLITEHGQRLTGFFIVDTGHALVHQFSGGRIFLVDVAIDHDLAS